MKILAALIFTVGLLVFGWRRCLSYLRFYQQEEYNHRRFLSWLAGTRAFDTRGSSIAVLTLLGASLCKGLVPQILIALLATTAFLVLATRVEKDPRSSGKVKLNMTERATAIAQRGYGFFILLSLGSAAFAIVSCSTGCSALWTVALASVLFAQLPPFCLVLANIVLWPAEKARQDAYIQDARRILAEVNPFVIGITGSYGKTGAKAALGEILTQTLGPTFWPRKSINTVLGNTRTIRETMSPRHKYAVMEMGAYNIGSVKKLCDFTPPKASLVTAVGIMHLERFGSPENIYIAKSEIAQALPPDGILVCNGDSPNARRMAREHASGTTLLYGFDHSAGPLDCYASDISFGLDGTRFVIHWKDKSYPARTPLLGRPALSNILGAFTMACALGAEPAYTTACLANLEPVDNRLVLDKQPGISYLRDAYNSNPTGFEAALAVLRELPFSRRVLMTPGMIELGDQQYDQNRRVASLAASVCDLIILVGITNREALKQGLNDAGYPSEKLIIVDTRDEALSVVQSRCSLGDLVLIENDLGDLHEGRVRF